ncbi:MAG: response regulator transcription factor [Acidobacteriaceae bacterium]|nr:response regulator transcription factor [Acidobacteriaceae bacterium]
MASAPTTTETFGGNPANLSYILGQQFESRPTSNGTPIVFLISGDPSKQESLQSLISRQGWQFETFESAREFLARPRPVVPSCLILDLCLPDLDRLEDQKQIARERAEVPIVVISGYENIAATVQAMKAGAVDFLLNPFSNEILLTAVRESLECSRTAMHRDMEISDVRNCYALLSRRERQVMALVVSGLLNKQVGGELGISEITVKAHRRQVMRKMKANSLPDLVRMSIRLGPTRGACANTRVE